MVLKTRKAITKINISDELHLTDKKKKSWEREKDRILKKRVGKI